MPLVVLLWVLFSCYRRKGSFFLRRSGESCFFGAFACLTALVLVIVVDIIIFFTVIVLVVAGFDFVSLFFVIFVHY